MSNKQEYVYANMIDREDNLIFVKKSDGYWYSNGSNKVSNTYGITQLDSNWSYDACIRNGKTVETSNRSTWTVISFFNDKNPVWVTGGTNVGSFGCITEDNKLYVWGRNAHGELGLGHTNSVSSPTLVTVPNNEKPFMYMMGDNQSVLVTTVGNMYISGYDTYVTVNGRSNITSFRKVPGVSNVTHFTVVDGNTPGVHIYYTTVDGFAYVIGEKSHCTPTKLNISNAKYCFGRNSDNGYAMITCEDGSSYFCNGTSITKTNVSGSVCCCTVNNYNNTYVSDINGKIYTGTSGSLSVNGTFSSNAAKPEIKVDGLAVSFPSDIKGTYDKSPNGLKYQYKVSFIQTDQITETSNVVNYEACQKLRYLISLYKILIISIFLKTLKIRVVS